MAKLEPGVRSRQKNPKKQTRTSRGVPEVSELPRYYPKPGPIGGRLIRMAIGLLKEHQLELPLNSHILIAFSGGADSTALARLVIRYGRRICPASQISLLHVNHGWRGSESDADEAFVRRLAESWGVPLKVVRLEPPAINSHSGCSWEELARESRKAAFQAWLEKNPAGLILTAHHADDLAETLLWRLFTGSASTHGGGIAVRHGAEVRPLLGVRKTDLEGFLKEEGLSWREDRTNGEGRFLRSRIRIELMPVVEALFPKAVEHLVELGLAAQRRAEIGREKKAPSAAVLNAFFGAVGLKLRRAHWMALRGNPDWQGEVHLPGGWRVIRELCGSRKSGQAGRAGKSGKEDKKERWILERILRS